MAAPASERRRDQVEHRRTGSGRVATSRHIELQGGRTGWTASDDVEQDEDGYDVTSKFFGIEKTPGSAAKAGQSSSRHGVASSAPGKSFEKSLAKIEEEHEEGPQSGSKTSDRSSRKSGRGSAAPEPTGLSDTDYEGAGYADVDYGAQDVDYGMDEAASRPASKHSSKSSSSRGGARTPAVSRSHAGDDEEEEPEGDDDDEEPRTVPKKRGPGRPPKASRAAVGKGASKAAGSKRPLGRPPKQQRFSDDTPADEEEGEEDEGEHFSPGGTDHRRLRQSLGTGKAEDNMEDGRRISSRRRWNPLRHWAGERVQYTEKDGIPEAIQAEKLGVLTPVLAAAGKHKSRSKSKDRSRSKDKERSGSKSRERSTSHSRSAGEKHRKGQGRGEREDKESRGRKRGREESSDEGFDSESDVPVRQLVKDDRGKGGNKASRGGGKGSGMGRPVAMIDEENVKAAVADAVDEAEKSFTKKLKGAVYEAGKGTARQAPLPLTDLPKGFSPSTSPNLVINGGGGMPMYQIAVIRQAKQLAYERLPASTVKPAGFPKPALAAAAFDAPEFISGTVRLEPRSIKDLESTSNCTQNCDYRLVNHSNDTPAEVAFVVIKPKASEPAGPGSPAPTPLR